MYFVHRDAQKPEIQVNISYEEKITIKEACPPPLSEQGEGIGVCPGICVSEEVFGEMISYIINIDIKK